MLLRYFDGICIVQLSSSMAEDAGGSPTRAAEQRPGSLPRTCSKPTQNRRSRVLLSRNKKMKSKKKNISSRDVEIQRRQHTVVTAAGAAMLFEHNPSLRLKPYQLAGLNWLLCLHASGYNCILADDMGLGKTIQSCAFLAYLNLHLNIPGPHLVVVPSSVLQNWEDEIETWAPALLSGLITYRGKPAERIAMRTSLPKKDISVILTTYTLFSNSSSQSLDDRKWLRSFNFATMICDEAQGLKNEQSSRHKNLASMKTDHRILLSGTPMQNNIGELLAVLKFAIRVPGRQLSSANATAGVLGQARPTSQDFAEYFQQWPMAATKRPNRQPCGRLEDNGHSFSKTQN